MKAVARSRELDKLVQRIKECRICVDCPQGPPLQHEPRPVLRVNTSARIGVFGQAPGIRVHKSGVPFTDPSGDRLRQWMDIDSSIFYDEKRIAIVPMGFCFPGYNEKGGDLPPRRECAATWRTDVLSHLIKLKLVLLVGSYAVRWHLKGNGRQSLTEAVSNWRHIVETTDAKAQNACCFPLPHPSWRNNSWLKANPWFEKELLPELQKRVHACLKN